MNRRKYLHPFAIAGQLPALVRGWGVCVAQQSFPTPRVANHKSALKRARQSLRRQKRNTHVKSTMRTHVKGFRAAVAAGDPSDAEAKFRVAERAIRKAVSKGVLPARRASRSVSRLAKQLNTLGS